MASPKSIDFTPRPAGKIELLRAFGNLFFKSLLRPKGSSPVDAGFGMVLDRHVPVLYSSCLHNAPLGIAQAAQLCRHAVLLVFFSASAEKPSVIRRSRRAALLHRRANPGHTLIFLCNTAREERMLSDSGEIATLLNQNAFVSEHDFRPLQPRPIVHEAVYNARLAPFKRHELTLDIASCGFIYYQSGDEDNASDALARQRHAALPGHVFINALVDGKPVLMTAKEVNEVYNQSSVGLCLSAREGAMFASMEYMLAGLPVVSTPSLGGRDVYFDDDYCIIARPDPREIRDAVAALKARDIPRDHIAARTRIKVERDRGRLEALLDALRARDGRQLAPREALFGPGPRIEWRQWRDLLDRLAPSAFD